MSRSSMKNVSPLTIVAVGLVAAVSGLLALLWTRRHDERVQNVVARMKEAAADRFGPSDADVRDIDNDTAEDGVRAGRPQGFVGGTVSGLHGEALFGFDGAPEA